LFPQRDGKFLLDIYSRPFGLGLERILKGAWRRWRGVRCVFSVLPVTLYMY
jgi:hypothetical protein